MNDFCNICKIELYCKKKINIDKWTQFSTAIENTQFIMYIEHLPIPITSEMFDGYYCMLHNNNVIYRNNIFNSKLNNMNTEPIIIKSRPTLIELTLDICKEKNINHSKYIKNVIGGKYPSTYLIYNI